MDFSRLEWGRGAKDTAVDKQRKYAVTADNKALRSFRKGCGANAKGAVRSQRLQDKVRSKRKSYRSGQRKRTAEAALMRSIFYTFQAGKMLAVYFACFPVKKNNVTA